MNFLVLNPRGKNVGSSIEEIAVTETGEIYTRCSESRSV